MRRGYRDSRLRSFQHRCVHVGTAKRKSNSIDISLYPEGSDQQVLFLFLPPGAAIDTGAKPWPGNTFQVIPSITGAFNRTLYSGSSVATYLGPHDDGSQFSCSSKVLLLDGSDNTEDTKAVQDRCAPSGCGADLPHIDTYTSAQACKAKAIGDLPLSPAFAISVR